MDPLSIGSAVVSLLTPFVKDAGQELAETLGQAGAGKVKELLVWMKSKFAGDPAATQDLQRFGKSPEKFGPSLEESIQQKADTDPQFRAEITQMMKELGPVIAVVQNLKTGKGVTGVDADNLRSGKVDVRQTIDGGENITGARIKDIG